MRDVLRMIVYGTIGVVIITTLLILMISVFNVEFETLTAPYLLGAVCGFVGFYAGATLAMLKDL